MSATSHKGLAQIVASIIPQPPWLLNTMWGVGGAGPVPPGAANRQAVRKRCSPRAMSDQMGYKASRCSKSQAQLQAKERQGGHRRWAKRREVVFEPWDDILRTYVGATLHDAVMEANGLFIEVHDIIGRGDRRSPSGYCRCLMKLPKPGSG